MASRNGRFAHYTSAENALKIIKTKCIWMRNTTCMADFREVHHGLDALKRYFASPDRKDAFDDALNSCSAGLATLVFNQFDMWWQATQLETYITSISEHDDREDQHGRLSMWRAFGNSTARVAIVVKLNLDIGSNTALGAELSPVGYFTDADVANQIGEVVGNIQKDRSYLQSVDRPWLIGTALNMLVSSIVCLKHEGFHEEKEWRVIHSPKRTPSPFIDSSIEVISGLPQRVYKIHFKNDSASGLTGLEPDEVIDRIIIGPTQFPWVMGEAFVSALRDAGVKDPEKRVFASQIPVRDVRLVSSRATGSERRRAGTRCRRRCRKDDAGEASVGWVERSETHHLSARSAYSRYCRPEQDRRLSPRIMPIVLRWRWVSLRSTHPTNRRGAQS